jgi:integrase/recombinase XerD
MSLLAPTMQAFFTERLITQRDSSPHTVACYRDTFRLLLAFASQRIGKQPCRLDVDDLDAPLIGAFLNHLEHDRGNSPRTRNNRLAAIHAFCRYAALRHPEHLATLGRVLAIPTKRYEQNTVSYLQLEEIKALLRAPDRASWLGRRDHALPLTMIFTGVRVTELVTLQIGEVTLATGAHIKVTYKGRKRRTVTLTPETVTVLRQWLKERQGQPEDPLFPTRRGTPLSRDAVELLVAKHAAAAAADCPPLADKRITPHTLRHTNAMLLRAGNIDIATIALWLGHESTKTTSIYEHADPKLKEQAVARIAPLGVRPGRIPPLRRLARVPTRPLIMPSDPPP